MKRLTGLTKLKQPNAWRCAFSINGRRISRVIYARDSADAKAKLDELRSQHVRKTPRAGRLNAMPKLSNLRDLDMVRAHQRGLCELSLVGIEKNWRMILRCIGDIDIDRLTTFRLDDYVVRRLEMGAGRATIGKELSSVKRAMKEAAKRCWIVSIPEMPNRLPPSPPGASRGKWHEPGVVGLLLENLSKPARDVFKLALLTGMRRWEIQRLIPSDIEPAPEGSGVAAVARLRGNATKTRRERTVGLTQEALSIVECYAKRPDEPPFEKLVAQAAEEATRAGRLFAKAGYKRAITLRDMRHIHATVLARDVGVLTARDALGHTSVATTSKYLHGDKRAVASAPMAVEAAYGQNLMPANDMRARLASRTS